LKELRDQRQQLAYQALAETAQRVVQSISITFPEPTVSKLGADQNNENRKYENDDFVHSQSQQCGPGYTKRPGSCSQSFDGSVNKRQAGGA
jgi:hypothetical protein